MTAMIITINTIIAAIHIIRMTVVVITMIVVTVSIVVLTTAEVFHLVTDEMNCNDITRSMEKFRLFISLQFQLIDKSV